MKTLNEQIDCAKRELAMRKNLYPKWVESGNMAHDEATHQIECMESIVATLGECIRFAERYDTIRKMEIGSARK